MAKTYTVRRRRNSAGWVELSRKLPGDCALILLAWRDWCEGLQQTPRVGLMMCHGVCGWRWLTTVYSAYRCCTVGACQPASAESAHEVFGVLWALRMYLSTYCTATY